MEIKQIKIYSLAEMKDKYIGKIGGNERDKFEKVLRADVERRKGKSKTK